MSSYRTGRHLGRTIYRDDYLIGIMDDAADASLVVEMFNARERVLAAGATGTAAVPASPERDLNVPQTCQDSEGRPVDSGDCELTGPHYVTTLGVPHPRTPADPRPTPVTCGRVGMHHCGITGSYHSHDSSVPLPEPLPSISMLIGPPA